MPKKVSRLADEVPGQHYSYLSDHGNQYSVQLRRIKTLPELLAFLEDWNDFAAEAHARVKKWTEADFQEFMVNSKKEARGRFTGDASLEKFGEVWMPELLMRIGMIEMRFHVPWGTAFNRLLDEGIIKHNGACYYWDPPKPVEVIDLPGSVLPPQGVLPPPIEIKPKSE